MINHRELSLGPFHLLVRELDASNGVERGGWVGL